MSTPNQNRTSPRLNLPSVLLTPLTAEHYRLIMNRNMSGRNPITTTASSAVTRARPRSSAATAVPTSRAGPNLRVTTRTTSRTSTSGVTTRTTNRSSTSGVPTKTTSRTSTSAVPTRTTSRTSTNGAPTRTSVAGRASSKPTASVTAPRVATRRSVLNRAWRGEEISTPIVEIASPQPFSPSTNLNGANARMSGAFSIVYCPICMSNIKQEGHRILATNCGHLFCDICLLEAYSRKKTCPMCLQATNCDEFREIFI